MYRSLLAAVLVTLPSIAALGAERVTCTPITDGTFAVPEAFRDWLGASIHRVDFEYDGDTLTTRGELPLGAILSEVEQRGSAVVISFARDLGARASQAPLSVQVQLEGNGRTTVGFFRAATGEDRERVSQITGLPADAFFGGAASVSIQNARCEVN